MDKATKPRRLRPAAKSLPECLREFLTPSVFRQVRKAADSRKKPRWDIQPLLMILLTMTWCCGDSLAEKFEAARGFYVVSHSKRRRPGKTVQGFQQAVKKLPMPVFRTLAAQIRRRIEELFGDRLLADGFIPLGCDGSRLECPRSAELERRLGQSGNKDEEKKKDAATTLWLTALVHLGKGVPWAWRFGKGGKASERDHLRRMLHLLPKLALVVTDAGYYGYDLILALTRANVPYLILDARYEKVRHGGSVIDCAVLIAIGITPQGKRSILGVSVSLSEAEVHWREFLQSLQDRGLHGVRYIVSDDHAGLKGARKARLAGVP